MQCSSVSPIKKHKCKLEKYIFVFFALKNSIQYNNPTFTFKWQSYSRVLHAFTYKYYNVVVQMCNICACFGGVQGEVLFSTDTRNLIQYKVLNAKKCGYIFFFLSIFHCFHILHPRSRTGWQILASSSWCLQQWWWSQWVKWGGAWSQSPGWFRSPPPELLEWPPERF